MNFSSSHVLYKNACYVQAGGFTLRSIANWVMGKLWEWIYRAGVSKKEVQAWITKTFSKSRLRQSALPNLKPEEESELVDTVARFMAQTGVMSGDFVRELLRLLDNPPDGYRWERDNFGRQRLIKVRSEIGEHGIVRGKGFRGKTLIGIWWTTKKPRGSAHRSLVDWIRKQEPGDIFLNWAIPGERGGMGGGREYGGFIIVPTTSAPSYAEAVVDKVQKATEAGNGESRLSAVTLDGLSEGKRVENSDKIRLPGINSIKFNWDFNTPDLLNGRVAEYKKQQEYLDLVQMLREARDAAK